MKKNKTDLQTAIKQAKSKILELAIHGKLVPQDSSDEPASVLLERLREEKEAKIAKGEIKRDKNDSYIYKNTTDNCHYQKFANGTEIDISDEIPFNIPNNWNWGLGIEIFNPMKSRKQTGDTFRYIDIETIDNKKHKVVKPKVLSVSDAPSRASREVSTGDVLFSLVRPYLENIALINEENQDCIASTGFFICKPNEVINPNYLFFLMTSNYVVQGLNQFMKGDNSPSINGDDITKWLYPIPPLAEQKRIVEKIENAFAKLDQIAEQLA
ncbi:MAG: restriction endonuclease subunit S [Spirochaetia bacterium]|nr:restriction endonuclease subunit S [Spirochaetia bacterium]